MVFVQIVSISSTQFFCRHLRFAVRTIDNEGRHSRSVLLRRLGAHLSCFSAAAPASRIPSWTGLTRAGASPGAWSGSRPAPSGLNPEQRDDTMFWRLHEPAHTTASTAGRLLWVTSGLAPHQKQGSRQLTRCHDQAAVGRSLQGRDSAAREKPPRLSRWGKGTAVSSAPLQWAPVRVFEPSRIPPIGPQKGRELRCLLLSNFSTCVAPSVMRKC
jgi:hypothetical protein